VKVIGNLTKDAIIRAAVSEGISVTQEIGSSVTFESATISYTSVVYDSSNQKIVIAYRDQGNSNYGTAIVGTVSGSSISFGTPTVFESAVVAYISGAYDSNNNKVVFSFKGASDYGRSVVGTVSGTSISFGSAANFESSGIESTGTAYDANAQRIVVAYRDDSNSNRGTAAVGTVSGTSISFGTPVVFKSAVLQSPIKITYDSTKNRVVIIYKNAGTATDDGEVIVGQVSGTSLTFGSSVTFESGLLSMGDVTYDSNAQRILISYVDENTSNNGFCCVVSIGGTGDLVPTVNARQSFNAATTYYISSVYDPINQKVVITFKDSGDSGKGKAIVATVGSTSATFGSEVEFATNISADPATTFDSTNNKVIIAYRDGDNSNYGTAIVGTVSGTSISFGSATVFEEASSVHLSAAFDSNVNKVVISYRDTGNSDAGTLAIGTVSGTSISFGTPFVFVDDVYSATSVTFDSNSKKIVASFNDDDNSDIGTSAVITVGFDNRGEVADGGHALVDTQGAIADNLSGLTAGQSYFVQTDGTLGTTAADPSVFAGTAVSATKLIVKG